MLSTQIRMDLHMQEGEKLSNYSESLERSRLSLYKPGMLCFKVLNNGMDSVLREKDANQILFAVLPLEYGMLVSGVLVGDILEANYLQLSSCFCTTTHGTSLSL